MKAKIICENCDKEYLLEYKVISDLFDRKCPECNSDDIFYRELEIENGNYDVAG